jgi:hypothetical protein
MVLPRLAVMCLWAWSRGADVSQHGTYAQLYTSSTALQQLCLFAWDLLSYIVLFCSPCHALQCMTKQQIELMHDKISHANKQSPQLSWVAQSQCLSS